jgi:uncharacterized membrane protein
MRYHGDPVNRNAVLAFLLSLGVCANILELFIPSIPFLPWLKPGLANAFTLSAIYLYGPLYGIQLAVLRSLIAGIFSGVPVSSLLIGGTGGVVSSGCMGLLYLMLKGTGVLSPLGLGMFGAFIHTITQLGVVHFLFVKNTYIFWQIPVIGPIAVATGAFTGLIAIQVINFIIEKGGRIGGTFEKPDIDLTPGPVLKFFILIGGSVFLFLVNSIHYQGIMLLLLILINIFLKQHGRLLIILRFIPLLLLTLLLNAFTTPGFYVQGFPLITYAGLTKGILLIFRLMNLICLSLVLVNKKDLISLLLWMERFIPGLSSPVEVGIRAVNGIPATVAVLKDFYFKAPVKGIFSRLGYLRQGLSNALLDILKVI